MRIDHEKVLNMWIEGKDAFTIACSVGCTASHIGSLVARYRKNGEPRAVRRPLGQGLRAAIPNNIKIVQRKKKFKRFPITAQALTQIVQAYTGPVTQCPTGFHSGHRPKCLAAVGL